MFWNLSSSVPEVPLSSSEDFQIGIWKVGGWNKEWFWGLLIPLTFLSLYCSGEVLISCCIWRHVKKIDFLGWELNRVFLWLFLFWPWKMEGWDLDPVDFQINLSLPRKLPSLFILTCRIEAKMLWKIQKGPLRGKKTYIPADKVVWGIYGLDFLCPTLFSLVKSSVL